MYLLIETSGLLEHNEISDFIKDIAENDYGFTVDMTVGNEIPKITLYGIINHVLKEIVSFDNKPDEEVVKFYLENYLDSE